MICQKNILSVNLLELTELLLIFFFIVSTQLHGFSYCYPTILFNIDYLLQTLKWLQVLYIDLRPGQAVKIGNAPV